jgi:hypothetical protein
MKISIDDIQVATENENDLRTLVHSIAHALQYRAQYKDNDSLRERGASLAREMNAGVLHIAIDGFTSIEEAMKLIQDEDAAKQAQAELQAATETQTAETDVQDTPPVNPETLVSSEIEINLTAENPVR